MSNSHVFHGYLKLLFLEHIWMWRIENIICQLCLAVNINRGCSFAAQELTEDLPSSVRKLQKRNAKCMFTLQTYFYTGIFYTDIFHTEIYSHSSFLNIEAFSIY